MTDHPSPAEIVLHVSDAAADLERALGAAATLREAFPDRQVRVIVNGPALDGVTGTDPVVAPDGVRVAACSLGLRGRGIDPGAVRPGIETVPGASVALVQAQIDGAVYLRI